MPRTAVVKPNRARRVNPTASKTAIKPKGGRSKATRFEEPFDEEDEEAEDNDQDSEYEDPPTQNSTLQALAVAYKKKASSAATRPSSVVSKVAQLLANARETLASERTETSEHISHTLTTLATTLSSDPTPDLATLAKLFGDRNTEGQAILQTYDTMMAETAVQRDQAVENAGQLLEAQASARAKSGRRTMKRARQSLEEGYEYQKLASDAHDLIKHYKRLIRV